MYLDSSIVIIVIVIKSAISPEDVRMSSPYPSGAAPSDVCTLCFHQAACSLLEAVDDDVGVDLPSCPLKASIRHGHGH